LEIAATKRELLHFEQALAIAREVGDRQGEGIWLTNLGDAYRQLGQVKKAIKYHERALTIAHEIGDRHGEALGSWNLGLLHEQNDPARAAGLMQVRVDYEREIGHAKAEEHAERIRVLLQR